MRHQETRRQEHPSAEDGPQYWLWEKAFELAVAVFKVVDRIPPDLGLALTGQMRLAALSIPSHLSHSRSRRSTREYARGLSAALHALKDLEGQVSLCCELGYANETEERRLVASIRELKRAATRILRGLREMLSADRLESLSDEISALVQEENGAEAGGRS